MREIEPPRTGSFLLRWSQCIAALALMLLTAASVRAQELPPLAHQVTGLREAYVVARGDTLAKLAARYGIKRAVLARENGLKPSARLQVGQKLRIDDRHIVPANLADGILLNLPQRMLFFFRGGALRGAYPAAVGKPTWPTPLGPFQVLELRKNPVWRVPASIQREMAMQGRVVKQIVPPGPHNPLGDRFIALSLGNLGIHSTNAPLTIFGFTTHGCVRLHPDDARELFDEIRVGQRGEIIYQPVLLARLADGRAFIEVHSDIYGKAFRGSDFVKSMADSNNLENLIDWKLVREAMRAADGVARDITRRGGEPGGAPGEARGPASFNQGVGKFVHPAKIP
jgi:L,D-transpeptidase ErfK/SrfK